MDPFPIKLPSPYSIEKTREFEYSEKYLKDFFQNNLNIKKDIKTFSQNIEFSEKFKDQAQLFMCIICSQYAYEPLSCQDCETAITCK